LNFLTKRTDIADRSSCRDLPTRRHFHNSKSRLVYEHIMNRLAGKALRSVYDAAMTPGRLSTLGLAALLCAATPPVSFAPVGPGFAPASDEYRRLWEADGERIVAAMERVAGLPFPGSPIEAIVSEGR
jgi:hypothetical protein